MRNQEGWPRPVLHRNSWKGTPPPNMASAGATYAPQWCQIPEPKRRIELAHQQSGDHGESEKRRQHWRGGYSCRPERESWQRRSEDADNQESDALRQSKRHVRFPPRHRSDERQRGQPAERNQPAGPHSQQRHHEGQRKDQRARRGRRAPQNAQHQQSCGPEQERYAQGRGRQTCRQRFRCAGDQQAKRRRATDDQNHKPKRKQRRFAFNHLRRRSVARLRTLPR